MRLLFAVLVATFLLVTSSPVRAQDEERQIALAMENYELGDHAAARDALTATLARLEAAGQGKSPSAARAHVLLGAVYALGLRDEAKALEHFTAGCAIDPAIELEAAYATGPVPGLLDQARAAARRPPPPPPDAPSLVDCTQLEGIAHESVDAADPGAARRIECSVGNGLGAAAVTLHYRGGSAGGFSSAAMARGEGCTYGADLPADVLVGGAVVQYYITAETAAGRPAASKGTPQSPFLVEVSAVTADVGAGGEGEEDEIPSGLGGQSPKPRAGGCAGCAAAGGGDGPGLAAALLVLAWLALTRASHRRRRAARAEG